MTVRVGRNAEGGFSLWMRDHKGIVVGVVAITARLCLSDRLIAIEEFFEQEE